MTNRCSAIILSIHQSLSSSSSLTLFIHPSTTEVKVLGEAAALWWLEDDIFICDSNCEKIGGYTMDVLFYNATKLLVFINCFANQITIICLNECWEKNKSLFNKSVLLVHVLSQYWDPPNIWLNILHQLNYLAHYLLQYLLILRKQYNGPSSGCSIIN